ncbi:hypothetical protein AAMO2058_000707700 [Amorphochlora amoebiformis]
MEGMKEIQLEDDAKPVEVKETSSHEIAKKLGWKPGPAGLVIVANEIARKVKKLLASADKVHKILGTVYSGERDHNKRILRTLKSFGGGKPKPADKKKSKEGILSSLDPLAKAAKLSEEMLARQAARRVTIANDMLEQVVNPLGRVVKDSRIKYAAIFHKQGESGGQIVSFGVEVKAKEKESFVMLKSCKEARRREREKMEKKENPTVHEAEGGISSLFSAISSGVSDIVRGKFDEILTKTESCLLHYKQTVTKANKRQEVYIRSEIPKFLKHYSLLSTSVTKMTCRALTSGFDFQRKDTPVVKYLDALDSYIKQIQPQEGIPIVVTACLDHYSDVINNFTCKRWTYNLPFLPMQVKARFSLIKEGHRQVSEQDFVVVTRPKKNAQRRGKQGEKKKKFSPRPPAGPAPNAPTSKRAPPESPSDPSMAIEASSPTTESIQAVEVPVNEEDELEKKKLLLGLLGDDDGGDLAKEMAQAIAEGGDDDDEDDLQANAPPAREEVTVPSLAE